MFVGFRDKRQAQISGYTIFVFIYLHIYTYINIFSHSYTYFVFRSDQYDFKKYQLLWLEE